MILIWFWALPMDEIKDHFPAALGHAVKFRSTVPDGVTETVTTVVAADKNVIGNVPSLAALAVYPVDTRSEEHTSELQSQ